MYTMKRTERVVENLNLFFMADHRDPTFFSPGMEPSSHMRELDGEHSISFDDEDGVFPFPDNDSNSDEQQRDHAHAHEDFHDELNQFQLDDVHSSSSCSSVNSLLLMEDEPSYLSEGGFSTNAKEDEERFSAEEEERRSGENRNRNRHVNTNSTDPRFALSFEAGCEQDRGMGSNQQQRDEMESETESDSTRHQQQHHPQREGITGSTSVRTVTSRVSLLSEQLKQVNLSSNNLSGKSVADNSVGARVLHVNMYGYSSDDRTESDREKESNSNSNSSSSRRRQTEQCGGDQEKDNDECEFGTLRSLRPSVFSFLTPAPSHGATSTSTSSLVKRNATASAGAGAGAVAVAGSLSSGVPFRAQVKTWSETETADANTDTDGDADDEDEQDDSLDDADDEMDMTFGFDNDVDNGAVDAPETGACDSFRTSTITRYSPPLRTNTNANAIANTAVYGGEVHGSDNGQGNGSRAATTLDPSSFATTVFGHRSRQSSMSNMSTGSSSGRGSSIGKHSRSGSLHSRRRSSPIEIPSVAQANASARAQIVFNKRGKDTDADTTVNFVQRKLPSKVSVNTYNTFSSPKKIATPYPRLSSQHRRQQHHSRKDSRLEPAHGHCHHRIHNDRNKIDHDDGDGNGDDDGHDFFHASSPFSMIPWPSRSPSPAVYLSESVLREKDIHDNLRFGRHHQHHQYMNANNVNVGGKGVGHVHVRGHVATALGENERSGRMVKRERVSFCCSPSSSKGAARKQGRHFLREYEQEKEARDIIHVSTPRSRGLHTHRKDSHYGVFLLEFEL